VRKNKFDVKGMSCYRDSFCKNFEDALFNEKNGNHYYNWGVLSLPVSNLDSQSYLHPETRITYTVKVLHMPTECLYPHSEVHVFVGNDSQLNPPALVKSWLRDIYYELQEILKVPV
jgi:hypothetical protein